MKRWLGYSALGLIAYLSFLLLLAPAEAFRGIIDRLQPMVRVQQLEGSLWAGAAQPFSLRSLQWNQLTWRWQPAALLSGHLAFAVRLQSAASHVQAQFAAGWDGRFRLSDIRGELPLRYALSMLTQTQLPVNGGIGLDVAECSIDLQGIPRSAQGSVQLTNVHTTIGRSLNLGDFVVQLANGPEGIDGELRDRASPLQLQGRLTLNAEGRYRLDAKLALRDQNNRELRQALRLLGRPDANGIWSLQLQGLVKIL